MSGSHDQAVISSSADDLEVPDWLNTEFIEKHFRNFYRNSEIRVSSFAVRSATAKGENYASSIYWLFVKFYDSSTGAKEHPIKRSLIVKTALTNGLAFETLSAHNVFNKEIEFYDEIVPQINRLLIELEEPEQLVAEIFGVCKTNKVMLFEDLALKGYGLASIQRGCNISEAKVIFKKLATFHAICAVLQEQKPDIFANFKYGALTRHSDVFHTFYYAQLDVIIEVLSSWPDYAHYAIKLQRFRDDFVEKGCQMFDPNPIGFNSFCHGDFWLNNVMIKQKKQPNESNFENVVFIDFQDSLWASPTIDLHYFLNTSLCESLRSHSFNELICFYHEHLEMALKRLSYQQHIPTKDEFLEQFNARNFYGFIASCTIQPFMITESTEDADLEAMITNNERSMRYRRNMYQQPIVQANLKKLIPIYDQMGLFD